MVQTRARRLAAPQTPSAQLDEDDEDDAFDSDPPPRAKRRKVSASKTATTAAKKVDKGKGKVRGKTGKLAFILDAPTEIVLGILSYLTPIDILNLSYVDKELRAMMTSPSSKSIWVAARQNVPGLPECPADFTESAYARFLFLNRCELCGAVAHGLPSMCFVRIRLCARCNKKNCVSSLRLFPRWRMSTQETLNWKLTPRALYYSEVDFPAKSNVVFQPAVERLRERVEQIPAGSEREEYIKERLDLIDKVMDHAKKLSTWLSNVRIAKGTDDRTIRTGRLRNILSRLEALGYDYRDMRSENVLRHRVVRQAVKLTDKLWPTVLRHLEPIVQNNRQLRFRREGRNRIQSHLKTRFRTLWTSLSSDFDKHTYIPVLDFLELPAVVSVIEASLDLDPTNIDFGQLDGALDSNMPTINDQIDGFRERMRRNLFAIWRAYNSDNLTQLPPLTEIDDVTIQQSLRLATSIFQLNKTLQPGCICRQPIHYATLFKTTFHRNTCMYVDYALSTEVQPALKYKWNHYLSQLTSSRISTGHMRTIVSGACLDIDTATIDDLNQLGLYYPVRENTDGASAVTAPPRTTWTAEYNRLLGPLATPIQAMYLGALGINVSPSDDDNSDYGYEYGEYGEYGYDSDVSF